MRSYRSIVLNVEGFGIGDWDALSREELMSRIQRNNMACGFRCHLHSGGEKTSALTLSKGKGREKD
jgi:lactam utilization protein B